MIIFFDVVFFCMGEIILEDFVIVDVMFVMMLFFVYFVKLKGII